MKRFIFGYDRAHPEACAADLKSRGIDAVVAGSFGEDAAEAFRRAEMEIYLCFGAFSLNGADPKDADLCVTASGRRTVWFSSGCPNDRKRAEANLTRAVRSARRVPGLSGIFVDGARFASFASPEGEDAFFTCFCPGCREKMRTPGTDAEEIRTALLKTAAGEALREGDITAVRAWLAWREACVKAYMDLFARRVHEADPSWKAGAFIFAPSLGRFTGQTMAACRAPDIISPMLYRAYPHAQGPACLGHEWAAFFRLMRENAHDFRTRFGTFSPSLPEGDEKPGAWSVMERRLLTSGFPPAAVGDETAAAKAGMRAGQLLAPILQIEDSRLRETEDHTAARGADGMGYYPYAPQWLPPVRTAGHEAM